LKSGGVGGAGISGGAVRMKRAKAEPPPSVNVYDAGAIKAAVDGWLAQVVNEHTVRTDEKQRRTTTTTTHNATHNPTLLTVLGRSCTLALQQTITSGR
jgi:hypothetical protein